MFTPNIPGLPCWVAPRYTWLSCGTEMTQHGMRGTAGVGPDLSTPPSLPVQLERDITHTLLVLF